MRLSILTLTFVVACVFGFWGLASGAQVIDSNPCQQACYERKAACATACSEHRNPIRCDEECDDALTDCLRGCRD